MIAFVTSAQWPQLTGDDRLAVREVERRGGRVVPATWSDDVDWRRFDRIVLRSCWDYHHRSAEFRAWLERMQALAMPVANAPETALWNLDKRYLLELAAAGVDVIETVVPERGASLPDLMDERGWTRAVLKPAVSADGDRTLLVDRSGAAGLQSALDALSEGAGALLQEFVPEVRESGELSLIFLGGELSHGVRKRPSAGEFRVQERFGGSVEPWRPDATVARQAEEALAAAPPDWLYARVDGCLVDGRLRLMELELIEPSLFLSLEPSAPARFAEALMADARRSG